MNDKIRDMGEIGGRFYGEYPAKVESIDDPDHLLRIQVRVAGIFPDAIPKADLPWAEIRWPVGAGPNEGAVIPFKVGQWIWCDFPYSGDSRRPRVTGSMHFAPGKQPHLPHEAWGGPSPHSHKRTGEEPAGPEHEYGKDAVFTLNGITFIVNKDGAVSILHRATGTEIAIDKDGKLVLHGEESVFLSAVKDFIVKVVGNWNATIDGKTSIVSAGTIDLDGGSGSLKGAVQGDCLCAFTRKPHAMISSTVKVSL